MADYLAVARRALATLPDSPNEKHPEPPLPEKHCDSFLNYPTHDDLPARATRYERIFGGKHHRLQAYIGQRVRCPDGSGILVDMKLERCTVDLGEMTAEGRRRGRFYKPEEIEVLQ